MLPLGELYHRSGSLVFGCDRAFDTDPDDPRKKYLEEIGIGLYPENQLPPADSVTVYSTAIESTHPAMANGKAIHRSDALKQLADLLLGDGSHRSVMVVGSSGKTSTACMLGWILEKEGLNPTIYAGSGVSGLAPWGARLGQGPVVLEVDESDGSIEKFSPDIAVVTSVTEDHKPLGEIIRLFSEFIGKSNDCVLSQQSVGALKLGKACQTIQSPASKLVGDFNRINESLAVASAECLGVSRKAAINALSGFPGAKRRLEIVAEANGIVVLDDFAHNPEKIDASLSSVCRKYEDVLVIFRPHGYAPTKMHHANWGKVFSERLQGEKTGLVLLPIFDAGGTAVREVTSQIVQDSCHGINAELASDYAGALVRANSFIACARGAIVVMGARDPGLPVLARLIADQLHTH